MSKNRDDEGDVASDSSSDTGPYFDFDSDSLSSPSPRTVVPQRPEAEGLTHENEKSIQSFDFTPL